MPKNAYPNEENYPAPSFKAPVTAPDIDPDEGAVVLAAISTEWIPVLLGAADQLLLPSTWSGTHDEINTALNRAANLKDIIGSATANFEIEAPVWEDENGDDSGEQLPTDLQGWFGYLEGVGFVDNLGGWIFTGAIALSFGVDAAIEFAVTLRRLRLLFRTGTAGAIVEVLVDGLLNNQVDTYSPSDGLIAVDVYPAAAPSMGLRALDADDPFTIDVVNTGTANPLATPVDGLYKMAFIKKRIWEAEIFPAYLRYNEITDQVEQTYDDGASWVPNPGQDPRHADTYRFPPVVSDNKRCQAAANMNRSFSDFLHEISGVASAATNAESLLTVIIGGAAVFFPEAAAVGVLAFLALDLASTIFSAGFAAVDAAFTNTVYDQLICIFDCNEEPDGTLTADDLAAVLSDINEQIGGLVYVVMLGYLSLVGEVGLSNMGAKGDAPADCSDCGCGWCKKWNVVEGWGDWYGAGGFSTLVDGVWQSGRSGGASINAIALDLTDIVVTGAIFRGHATNGANGGSRGIFRLDPLAEFYLGSTLAGDIEYNWSGEESGTFTIQANLDTIADPATSTWHEVILSGPGSNPFGEDNC